MCGPCPSLGLIVQSSQKCCELPDRILGGLLFTWIQQSLFLLLLMNTEISTQSDGTLYRSPGECEIWPSRLVGAEGRRNQIGIKEGGSVILTLVDICLNDHLCLPWMK